MTGLPAHHIQNFESDSNIELRIGSVVDIIYPNDERSLSKKIIEYDVEIQFLSALSRTASTTRFPNISKADILSSYPDKQRILLRPAKTDRLGYSKGTKVIVAFLDGSREKPIILFSFRDIERDNDLDVKDNKIYFDNHINGVVTTITTEGKFTQELTGPVDIDNKTTKTPDQYSRLEMLTNGSIQLASADKSQGEPKYQFKLNTEDQTAIVKSPNGLRVGDATDYMLLGSSFRNAQKELDNTLKNNIQAIVLQLTKITAYFASISTTILTPTAGAVACGPIFANITESFGQTIRNFTEMYTAIQKFEKSDYLSSKNKLD